MFRFITHLLARTRMGRERTRFKRFRILPCRMCGFAAPVAGKGNWGAQCLYYDLYIKNEDLSDPQSSARTACLKDGNNFCFRIKGMTPYQLLQWRVQHTDWYLTRTALRLGAIVGVLSLLMTAAGMWIRS